jgi:hypothetical protein
MFPGMAEMMGYMYKVKKKKLSHVFPFTESVQLFNCQTSYICET